MWHKLLVIINITFIAGHALCMQQQKAPKKTSRPYQKIDEKIGTCAERLQKLKQESAETLGICFSNIMLDLNKEGYEVENRVEKNSDSFFSTLIDWSTEKKISERLAQFNKHSTQLNEWENDFNKFAVDLLQQPDDTKTGLLDAEINNNLLQNIARLRKQLFKDMVELMFYQEIRFTTQMTQIKQIAQTAIEKK